MFKADDGRIEVVHGTDGRPPTEETLDKGPGRSALLTTLPLHLDHDPTDCLDLDPPCFE